MSESQYGILSEKEFSELKYPKPRPIYFRPASNTNNVSNAKERSFLPASAAVAAVASASIRGKARNTVVNAHEEEEEESAAAAAAAAEAAPKNINKKALAKHKHTNANSCNKCGWTAKAFS